MCRTLTARVCSWQLQVVGMQISFVFSWTQVRRLNPYSLEHAENVPCTEVWGAQGLHGMRLTRLAGVLGSMPRTKGIQWLQMPF